MNISSTISTSYTSPYDAYKYYTRIGGLASGLDTDSIIQGLMSIQKARYNKLYQQQQLLQWQREDYMNMANEIASFRDYVFDLRVSSSKFISMKAWGDAISGGYIDAAPTANSLVGDYQIKVDQIATPAFMFVSKISSTDLANIQNSPEKAIWVYVNDDNAGNVSIDIKTSNPQDSKYIKIDVSNLDVDGFERALASALKSTGKVDAYYDNVQGKLFIKRLQTGALTAFNLNSEISSIQKDSTMYSNGQNAKVSIKIGNVDYWKDQEFSQNTFTFLGTVITLKKETLVNGVFTYQSFAISKDVDSTINNIKEFLSKYNDLIDKIYSKITERPNREFQPLTEEQKSQMKDDDIKKWEEAAKKGLLYNDSILGSFLNNVRYWVYEKVDSLPEEINQLTDIGIETYSYFDGNKAGKLYIKDEEKLRKALENDPNSVYKLFTASVGTLDDYKKTDPQTGKTYYDYNGYLLKQGLLQRIYYFSKDVINKIYEKAGKPYFTSSYDPNSYIGKQLRYIATQMNAELDRLEKIEERYYKQFSLLESLMSQMNAQSSWLSQQFSSK
ncbi:flagellar hook protein FliD [Caldicellulosiruptor changbaiensis]|uniref:Flagellar hook-associated protein 2 n=1 Tax=Caldicellulosiruptor changbaiensis TaxID=1222016 RepID=A0A3T0D688_9FIRM|nr:flagellar filament capping protein FliD [Caldicellulosiruptor changbaiensis]AZT90564.1 flagellar hook protein FliD [Caldicellulosiruptor changbaiensis]